MYKFGSKQHSASCSMGTISHLSGVPPGTSQGPLKVPFEEPPKYLSCFFSIIRSRKSFQTCSLLFLPCPDLSSREKPSDRPASCVLHKGPSCGSPVIYEPAELSLGLIVSVCHTWLTLDGFDQFSPLLNKPTELIAWLRARRWKKNWDLSFWKWQCFYSETPFISVMTLTDCSLEYVFGFVSH